MNSKREKTSGGEKGRLSTYFASAERRTGSLLEEQAELVARDPLIRAIEEVIDGYLLILNPERQIIAVNQQFLNLLGLESCDSLVGDRPGEVLGCIHSAEGPGGCGTSRSCPTCGAVLSILTSQRESKVTVRECLFSSQKNGFVESNEFRVRATPVQVGSFQFTVLVFNDISGQKRREALERVFFHDILNTIGGLKNWSTILKTVEGVDTRKVAEAIVTLSNRLAREVEDQQQLTLAERGDLVLHPEKIAVSEVFTILESIFLAHGVWKGECFHIERVDPHEKIVIDSSLLIRVLTNMIKNALEEVGTGESIRVWFERMEDAPVFHVWNPGVISERVAIQIFQRSFSTKCERGRGLGTYSMKLFGERYLGGKVSFESTEETGTVFSIRLPAEGTVRKTK